MSPAIPWRWRLARGPHRPWPWVIVAFHRVWSGSEDELSYPPHRFGELCAWWRDHYEIVPLAELLARHHRGDPRPAPVLAITFDDGYADNAEIAAPILLRLGLPATFFVTTGFIGTAAVFPWDRALPRPPRLMSWSQVRALRDAGFAIGAHTHTHPRLSALAAPAVREELRLARARLRAELGDENAGADFAYPFGGPLDCDEAARHLVRECGHRCCLSCFGGLVGPSDAALRWRRICVSPRWHPHPAAWSRAYARALWRHRESAAAGHW